MELVEGANLAEVARGRVFTWEQAAEIALPIASALAYAHARGIVHRDLTPGNVLIESATGRVVVSDFGLARLARSSTSVTTQGMLLGTPEYWSPEQARGARQRDRDRHVRARLPALLAALRADALRGRRPAGRRASTRARGRAVRSRRARAGAPARGHACSSTRCSRPTRPTGRPRSRCSRCSGLLRRRSPRRPPTRSRRPSGRPPSSPSRSATAVLEPPTRHAARKRRRSRRMAAVAVGIAAAGALAFVGATIANADRVVEVPRVTGMTVPQARAALAEAAHVDRGRCPARRRQPCLLGVGRRRARDRPDAAARHAASSGQRSISSSASAAARPSPSCRTSRGRRRRRRRRRCAAPASPSSVRARGVVGGAGGPGRLERRRRRRRGAAAGADRHRGLERTAARPCSRCPRGGGRRRGCAARRQLRDRRRRGGVGDGRRPAPSCVSHPIPAPARCSARR